MSFDELRQQYREQERWIDLAVLLERERKAQRGPDAAEITRELMTLLEGMCVTDPASAQFAEPRLESLYLELRTPEALEALAGLYLDRSERQIDDVEKFVASRRRCAEVFERDLGRPDSALLVLLSSLGSDVLAQPAFLEDLERLGRATGDWGSVFVAVDAVLDHMQDDDRAGPILVQLGRWSGEYVGDDKRAERYLERALELCPDDLVAIGLLESHCRRRGDFEALGEMIRFRIHAAKDVDAQARGWFELAELAAGPLDDNATEIEALERISALRPEPQILARLEAVYRRAGRFDNLATLLRGQISTVQDSAQRQALSQRLGEALARVGAIEDAIQGFREAASDAKSYVQTLKREAEHIDDAAKARVLAEIGHVYAREIRDNLAAQHYYGLALSVDSQLVDAAEPMADVYLSEQAWDKAAPLLETLLRRHRVSRDAVWLHRRYVQYAQCCDHLGRRAPALAAFREAYELRPDDVPTIKGFSKLLWDCQEWEKAVGMFGKLLSEHVTSLTPQEVAAINFMAAKAFEALGDEGRAIAAYQRVTQFNPKHRGALRALVEIFDRREDWTNFVQVADLLVVVEPEPLVRFRQLSKVGEIWANQLNRPDLAMVAYRAALDIDPHSIVVLRKLLDLYTRTEKYPLAVKVLERLVDGEQQPKRRAMLHYTAGVLYRDHVGDLTRAVEHFDAALDDDLDLLKAFEAIDRVWTQNRQWKELERAYRRMLKRVTGLAANEQLEWMLWEGLAEIYRSRLGEFDLAVDAYKVLQTMRPKDDKYRKILAELYEKMGDAEGALKEHRRLIAEEPKRVDSYHVLHEAYLRLGNFDAAWCVAGALSFLRASTAHEESFYQKYLGRNLRLGRGKLTQEMYAKLVHPAQDATVGALLSYAAEGLRSIYGVPLRAHDIDPKRDRIASDSPHVFRQIWNYVAGCLALPAPPELFQIENDGLLNLNAETPAVGVGPQRRDSVNDRESAFYAAKLLYAMRPEHYLATVFPPEANQTMLMAVVESVDSSVGYSKQLRDPNFDKAVKELRKLPEQARAPLRKLVARFQQKGGVADVHAWTNAVEHSSTRAGLLLCGDLGVAASCVRYGGLHVGSDGSEERIRQLLLFAVSETYFELRAHLDLAIGGARPF